MEIPRIIQRLNERVTLIEAAFGERTKTISECVGVSADGRVWRYFRSEERTAEGVLCVPISYGFTELPPGSVAA